MQIDAAEVLKRPGCHVGVVGNGQEAGAAYKGLPYDLVLRDCDMSVMDDFNACRRIRVLEAATRRAPIIAMTASALKGDREKCLGAGIDDYLPKPVRRRGLTVMVKKWLDQASAT